MYYGDAMMNKMEYMNGLAIGKTFSYMQLRHIQSSMRDELKDRKILGLAIDGKTKKGRELLNSRVAQIANGKLISLGLEELATLTAKDVQLYKKCYYQEYSDRTGRCAYGYKELRKRYGYDENTGYELEF